MLRQTGAVYNIRITYVASRDYSMIDTHFDEKKNSDKKVKFLCKKSGATIVIKIAIYYVHIVYLHKHMYYTC